MDISSSVVQRKNETRFQYSIPFFESSMPPGLSLSRERTFDVVRFQAATSDPCVVNSEYCIFQG